MADNQKEKTTEVETDKVNTTDKTQSSEDTNTQEQTEGQQPEKDADMKKEEQQAEAQQEEKDPLAEAQQQIEMLKDQLLRTAAEFDNFKKRTVREKAELIRNGGEKTVAAILPVLDDFERAMADKSEDPKVIREGIEMIFNKFVKSLESIGVKKIDALDTEFNTDFHEAIAMVPGMGDDKKGKVIDCVQTGYTMNDKVIRHAKVAVAQ
jgi:molecular chaperone GrpE